MFQSVARRSGLAPVLTLLFVLGCAPEVQEELSEEVEALSRTAFTERIENFFEYEPLRAGAPSPFLIHLTDLEDGSPVAQARVDLRVRGSTGTEVAETRAQIGRVTGIYVAELAISNPGIYAIEFRVENDRLSEVMTLEGFEVR